MYTINSGAVLFTSRFDMGYVVGLQRNH